MKILYITIIIIGIICGIYLKNKNKEIEIQKLNKDDQLIYQINQNNKKLNIIIILILIPYIIKIIKYIIIGITIKDIINLL